MNKEKKMLGSSEMKTVILFWAIFAVSGVFLADSNATRTRRQAGCGKDEFQCTSGQCISKDLKCNGAAQCDDGSDETAQACGNSSGSCVLPPHPSNGQWKVVSGGSQNNRTGDTVPNFSTLNVFCNENYIRPNEVKDHLLVLCVNGEWAPEVIGECVQLCPPILQKPHVWVTCNRNEYVVDCYRPTADTIATFQCEPFYESDQDLSLTSNRRTCVDGSWNAPPINCIPKCGVRGSEVETLTQNRTTAIEGDWPWHVGLYRSEEGSNRKKYICGGTLINPNTILTAAHCLTHSDSGLTYPKTDFMVAVGKQYREFDDKRDLASRQVSKLKKMHIPFGYIEFENSYPADIAVLKTETEFQLTRRLQPVCFDQSGIGDEDILKNPGKEGYVVGWGYTAEDGSPADSLTQVPVPYVLNDQCEKALPHGFNLAATTDKMCGGYRDKGIAVCKGDVGSGLVFRSRERGRYFIRGVVSVTPEKKTGGCDNQRYSVFTRVHPHSLFIYRRSK